MKARYRRFLLALVAVFALSAVATAAASAASPEFKPVPAKKKFTSTSSAVIFNLTTSVVECSKSTTAGEITGASTLGKVVVKFTGCELKAGACQAKVKSLTGKEGEIITNALKGELGTVKTTEAASGVGLLLEPEVKKLIATFAETKSLSGTMCLPESEMTGSLAGEVTPTGKKQLTSTLIFASKTAGSKEEKITEITVSRGKVKPLLLAWFGEELSMSANDQLTFEEALEVT